MPAPFPENLQKKVTDRLAFYQDLGIAPFYSNRRAEAVFHQEQPLQLTESAIRSTQIPHEEPTLPKTLRKPDLQKLAASAPSKIVPLPLPAAPAPSLFDASDRIVDDTLLRIREDLGDCTRCKLHKHRHTIVFGDGNPKAELVFVGEGPGADEDAQGLPFVGRAGKLLTQMIEAMGLQRKDVYICNVVKCRPPENRTPEEDEVSTCTPFLLRQLDVIAPKVIVCLGAVAAKSLLKTNRGISQFRGQWLDFRSSKLMATYHPAYLLRNPNAKGEVWKDLQKVMALLGLQAKKGKPA
ncbi:MAG TPA: uracil-DNA glycosylase [Candidatus Acidoferrum sp.]|nr:uracil-DNA glycosylase [Candidatus Acidoferrum sp.]